MHERKEDQFAPPELERVPQEVAASGDSCH